MTTEFIRKAKIEADPSVPIVRITRDFAASVADVLRAHTDPELFVRWVGPDRMATRVVEWDARDGGSWRYVASRDGTDYGFRGCFHQITDDRIVQTFTFEGLPDDVALETLRLEAIGDRHTRLHAQSLVDSFEGRDAWLRSGMETGIDEGYAKLDALLGPLVALDPADRHRRIAQGFTERAEATKDWSAPSPVAQWRAVDVVGHLVTWLPEFLHAGGVDLPPQKVAYDTDPAGAWREHAAAVQALLDDPATATKQFTHPRAGQHRLDQAIDIFYTSDIFMHTWDLARAAGLDDRLDAEFAAHLLGGMEGVEAMIRESGQYGARVPVSDDADPQRRLIGFIGRDPDWRP